MRKDTKMIVMSFNPYFYWINIFINPLNVVKSVLDETGIKYTANNWEKYGEKRIYVNLYFKNQTKKFYVDLLAKRAYGQSPLRYKVEEALGF